MHILMFGWSLVYHETSELGMTKSASDVVARSGLRNGETRPGWM